MIGGFVALLLFAVFQLGSPFFSYPWHASCRIEWVIPNAQCQDVRASLVNQIDAWQGEQCPGLSDTCPALPCGQRCKYSLVEQSEGLLKALHRTPAKDYKDDLIFKFANGDDGACRINATSESQLWYALLDMGTNYCNLWNLMDGAGFIGRDGLQEETSTAVCTQYDQIDCERF